MVQWPDSSREGLSWYCVPKTFTESSLLHKQIIKRSYLFDYYLLNGSWGVKVIIKLGSSEKSLKNTDLRIDREESNYSDNKATKQTSLQQTNITQGCCTTDAT